MTSAASNKERLTLVSSRPFEAAVAAFEAALGRPNPNEMQNALRAAKTYAEMEAFFQKAAGSSGFIEFARFDLGAILRKESGQQTPKSVRFLSGNPLIMKEMVRHVPDAGSYTPATVLIDERPDGVFLSYDRMANLLAPYGKESASQGARALDAKVEALLRMAAG